MLESRLGWKLFLRCRMLVWRSVRVWPHHERCWDAGTPGMFVWARGYYSSLMCDWGPLSRSSCTGDGATRPAGGHGLFYGESPACCGAAPNFEHGGVARSRAVGWWWWWRTALSCRSPTSGGRATFSSPPWATSQRGPSFRLWVSPSTAAPSSVRSPLIWAPWPPTTANGGCGTWGVCGSTDSVIICLSVLWPHTCSSSWTSAV